MRPAAADTRVSDVGSGTGTVENSDGPMRTPVALPRSVSTMEAVCVPAARKIGVALVLLLIAKNCPGAVFVVVIWKPPAMVGCLGFVKSIVPLTK